MKIRLLQKKDKTFWIQQPKKLFNRTYWITLRDRKKFFKMLLYYVSWNAGFPFLIYGVGSFFYSVNFLGDSLELLTSSYAYWASLWSIIFSLRDSRIKDTFYVEEKYRINNEIRYNKKVININTDDLVKSGKRTIFGKFKEVYYMNKKDLRKQKLEKLKSISK